MSVWVKFNLNFNVRVKLNDKGRKILKERWEALDQHFPRVGPFVVEVDGDGFYHVQLWRLMEIFGPNISLGAEPPFDTEIELDTDN